MTAAASCRRKRPPAALRAALLVGFALASAAGQARAADPLQEILPEPGFPVPEGRLLLPLTGLDQQGRAVKLSLDALTCLIDGVPVPVVDLIAPVPTVILVISDQELPGTSWGSILREGPPPQLVGPDSPHWLGLWDASAVPGIALPLQPASNLPVPDDLRAPARPRLWDAVLAGIQRLAILPDAPARRVVLVVSDLQDEQASEHPMAACLEAAQHLAIPVHGVVSEGAAPLAVARLQHLVAGSGGRLTTGASVPGGLRSGLERILAAEALLLTDPGLQPPAEVVLSVTGGPSARARIVVRPSGRYTPGPGLIAALAVILAVALGWLAWRHYRRRPVGYLVSADPLAPWRQAVPAAGLTIGRAPDNGLALAENRVSKHHALVRWRRGQVQLIDLRSTNGTQVGGRPVRTAALQDGDTIVLGDAVTAVFQGRAPQPRQRR
jgi:hypothetical protein